MLGIHGIGGGECGRTAILGGYDVVVGLPLGCQIEGISHGKYARATGQHRWGHQKTSVAYLCARLSILAPGDECMRARVYVCIFVRLCFTASVCMHGPGCV